MAPRKTALAKGPQDDHVLLLISGHQDACKLEMLPIIGKAQQTAEKAHGRVDDVETRLARLDDEKVGMVTTLWNERNKVIAVGGVLLVAIIINIVIGLMGEGKIDKNTLKEAVKAALIEVKP
jgi:hypothetical protein